MDKFMKGNDLNVFLETGVTNKKIKTLMSSWQTCQENHAETIYNGQYIHNGKGTVILKDYQTKTQRVSDHFNNEKQVLTRLYLKDNLNNDYRYAIGAIHSMNGRHKSK